MARKYSVQPGKDLWFTSDCHWQHRNILKFCPETRLGSDVEEHDETLIQNWNRDVKPNDEVYCLGDMFFCEADKTREILTRLNGNIHLVYGNHDKIIQANYDIQCMFKSVQHYLELRVGRKNVILFHFPIMEWNKGHYGAYHLFGHVHGSLDENERVVKYRMMDVGVDGRPNGIVQRGGPMSLWNWNQIDDILKDREVFNHHKN